MTTHVFVDEYKEHDYLLAATAVPATKLATSRRSIRSLVMPRQRRLHFKKESDSRRGLILASILGLGTTTVIYAASGCADEKVARAACLTSLVADVAATDARRLVIETDEAAVHADRSLLFPLVRKLDLVDVLRYEHLRAHEEPLLAVPDAIAWCWGKSGRWRSRVREAVSRVQEV